MGATKEQRILNTLKKKDYAPQTSIATDMFLPNLSGIADHPEAKNTFLKLDCSNDPLTAGLEVTGNIKSKHSGQPILFAESTGVNQSAYCWLKNTGSGSGILKADGALQFQAQALGELARFHTNGYLGIGTATPSTKLEVAGTITATKIITGDHGTAATDEVVNVCYGTGDPPAANTTTEGTLFIKYTA